MNNKIRIAIFSGIIFFALLVFLRFYSYKQGNWYLIDSNGDLVSRIGYEKSVGALMIDDEKYYLLTRVNGFDADSIFYRETLFVVNKEGKVIFKGSTGEDGDLQVEDRFSLIYKGKKIYLDSQGKITFTVPDNITIADDYICYGMMSFYYNDDPNNAKYGYINTKGEVIIEPKFYGASSFSKDGLAAVKGENEKYGYIDINGDIVISEIYDTAFDFNDGVAPVYVNGRSFFIDTKGTEVIDIDGYIFSEGFTVVRNDDRKYAYFDKSGKALTDYIFDFATEFKNGYASVEIDGLYGCIDYSGNFAIEPSFKLLGDFSDNGLAAAKDENDLFGFVNNKGEWVIEPKYKTVYGYYNGVNLVEIP